MNSFGKISPASLVVEKKTARVFLPKFWLSALAGGVFLIGMIGGWRVAQRFRPSKTAASVVKQEVKKELAYEKTLRPKSGREDVEFKYSIVSAQLLEEITLKNQKVRATGEKTFLILTIKITNDGQKGLSLNARDYVRLAVEDSGEWLAPEIHNDPLEVQAISTKYSRLGFLVGKSDRNFRLQIGEINGEKDSLKISL